MKTFLEFLYEAEGAGEHAKEIANLRRQAQEAMRKGDMARYAELAKEMKELQFAEKVGRHLRGDEPTEPQGKKIPGLGQKAQKPRDVITTGTTTLGTIPNVDRPGTVTRGERVGGRYNDPSKRTQAGGRGIRIQGRSGPFGVQGPY